MHDVDSELVEWAGDDSDAIAIAGRGATRFGFARFTELFVSAPETWMTELDGTRAMRRWRQALRDLSSHARRLARRIALSPSGLDVSTMVVCSIESGTTRALRHAVESGWVQWQGDRRVQVPPMRRPLLGTWLKPEPDDARWIARYAKRRLSHPSCQSDQACLAECLRNTKIRRCLATATLRTAAERLRRTKHVELAMGALRERLASEDVSHRQSLQLRQTLGGALIEMGAYRESTVVLRDRSRASRVMRAHAHIRLGEVRAGQRILRALGPKQADPNWDLQWSLAAIDTHDARAESHIQSQLTTADDTRRRGLVWALYAEWADRRGDKSAVYKYQKAIADLSEAGDAMVGAYCQARYARALARCGRKDESADVAVAAWQQIQNLPGAALRGLAALACVESGVGTADTFQRTLQNAAGTDLPELAREARAALGCRSATTCIALSETDAQIDGRPLALAPNGPPWRVLAYLCMLPPASVVSIDELFRVGWPGERAQRSSQRRRVHTAIWTLRRAGLRDVLETVGRNRYRLSARVVTESVDAAPK